MRKIIVCLLYTIIYVITVLLIKKYFSNLNIDIVLFIGVILGGIYTTVYWNWADVMDKKDRNNKDKEND